MGLDQLWPHLVYARRVVDARNGRYAGKRLAVDVSVLGHGAVCNPDAAHLMVSHGVDAPGVAVNRVVTAFQMLKAWNITPLAVFDGASRPDKAGEAQTRKETRDGHMAEARRLHAMTPVERSAQDKWGDKFISECRGATRVTEQLREQIVVRLRALGVSIHVAPYEADGQMAWMYQNGEVDAVMTCDGDLFALGCRDIVRLEPSSGTGARGPFGWMNGTMHVYELPTTGRLGPLPDSIDLAWACRAYGTEVFLAWGKLVGCDYNDHAGFQQVGAAYAWRVITALGNERRPYSAAAEWTGVRIVDAITTLGGRPKNLLPADAAEICEKVHAAFQDHSIA
jgi:hypothetical protein